KKSKAQGDRAEQDRDDFEPSDHEKDHDHNQFQEAGSFAFGPENVHQESAHAVSLNRRNNPECEKDRRHRRGHIEVGVSSAQERLIDMKEAVRRIIMSPTNSA